MNDTHTFLTPSKNDGNIPQQRLHRQQTETELPTNTLSESGDTGKLPDTAAIIDRSAPADEKPAMEVRLTAEEPEIPCGSLREKKNPNKTDEVALPDEYIREERPMPRLH